MATLTPSPPPDATSTRRGLVSLLAQSFSGLKTFLGGVAAAGVTPIATNVSTLGTALLRWADVHTHAVTFADGTVQTTRGQTSSLASVGGGTSLVKTGTGPSLAVRSLVPSVGISINPVGDTLEIAATTTVKPVVGDGSNVVVTEGPTEIEVALAADVAVDNLNARGGPAAWLTIGPNLTTGRVRLGAAGVLTHVLGPMVAAESIVSDGGTIRTGPLDGQQRVLQQGPNTRVSLKGQPGYSLQAGFLDTHANINGCYVLDLATRYVRVFGLVAQNSNVLVVGSTPVLNLPTAIRPPSGVRHIGHLYNTTNTTDGPQGLARVLDGTLYFDWGGSAPTSGTNRLWGVDIGFFLA